MPRPSKGVRLYLRKRKGRIPVWVILDEGGSETSTGTSSRSEAETFLAEYLASKHRPSGPVDAHELTISHALLIYAEDHAPDLAAAERVAYAIEALEPFWGHLSVASINGATARRYTADRGVSASTVRRELGVMQAAINHCAKEGHLLNAPLVWKPAPSDPKDRWLTRQEAAYLLKASRKLRKDGRHLNKFIITALYTGTRKAAILGMRIDQASTNGGWVDTEHGVMYRKPQGKRQTKKRQTPARLPRQFLAHVKRWKANGAKFVVQDYNGNRVGDIRKGWANAIEIAQGMADKDNADLDFTGVTPHTLKHTAVTWAMQRGADLWDAASFFGTSVQTIEKTYGHHHPDHQGSAVRAMERR
ncbi:MAG: integrase [Sphingomonadales bacterium]|nr:MAG: integrase [Sphingomonadales bacterium]